MSAPAKKNKIYFAHPMGTYFTDTETEALIRIKKLFPGYEIVNPNHFSHQRAANGKISYFTQLASECDALVYLPFGDNTIGIGIAEEVKSALKKNREVHELHVKGDGMPSGMCSKVEKLDTDRVLSMDETKAHNREAQQRPKGEGNRRGKQN